MNTGLRAMKFCLAAVTGFLILCFVTPSQGKLHVKNLQIINCGNDSDPIQLEEATLGDGKKPNFICGKIRFEVKENITAPIQVKYNIDKKDKSGEYRPTSYKSDNDELTDICPLLVSEGKKCTSNSKKIQLPCRCPVLKGTYFAEKSIYVPSFIEDGLIGDYRAKLRGWHSKERLICYDATFTIDNTS